MKFKRLSYQTMRTIMKDLIVFIICAIIFNIIIFMF